MRQKLNWAQMILTALIAGIAPIAAGLALSKLQSREPRLVYSAPETIPFTGTTEVTAIYQVTISNKGNREVEGVACHVEIAGATISKWRVLGEPSMHNTATVEGGGLDFATGLLNPSEAVRILVTATASTTLPSKPAVSLRAKGIVGIEESRESERKGARQEIFFGIIAAIAVLGTTSILTLIRRRTSRFSDNFSGDLRDNWDFEGNWQIPETGTLCVTQSDAGGLSKAGASWENYTFTFKARIIKTCLGVILRATDLNNYFMLQINPDRIRPHQRFLRPMASATPPRSSGIPGNQENAVTFTPFWQVFEPATPINPPLTDWFDVRIVVREESVKLYINDQLRHHQDGFLKIPMGKIGFRNSGEESALVKDVRVVVQL